MRAAVRGATARSIPGILGVRSVLVALVAASSFVGTHPARAQEVIGYQLGVEQSLSTVIGEDLNTQQVDNTIDLQDRNDRLVAANLPAPPIVTGGDADLDDDGILDRVGTSVSPFQGFQLITTVFGDVTYDRPDELVSQGIVLSGAFSQLFPFGVDQDNPQAGALDENITTAEAGLRYLARFNLTRWQLAFEGAYNFSLNGVLLNAGDGSVQGSVADDTSSAATGAFTSRGLTHIVNGLLAFGYLTSRWDTSLFVDYNYTKDGVFSLAPGVVNQQGQTGARTNLNAFAAASVHTLTPGLVYRNNIGRLGLFRLELSSSYSVSEDPQDEVTITGLQTTVTPATFAPPEAFLHSADMQVDWRFTRARQRRIGFRANGSFSQRRATGTDGTALPGSVLGPDALLYSARAFYEDLLPWRIQLNISAGAGQAHLFQAPLGFAVFDVEAFDTARSGIEPVGAVSLRRRFDPVELQLDVFREIDVGIFGTSAILTEAAALRFVHLLSLSRVLGRRDQMVTTVGFNFNRTNGVGREQFPIPDGPGDINRDLIASTDNVGFGANVGVAIPLFRQGLIQLDAVATYNFNWVDSDPNGLLDPAIARVDCDRIDATFIADRGGNRAQVCADLERDVRSLEASATLEPSVTHVALFTLRGTWGRGVAAARRRAASSDLDAFTRNPRDGSPLITTQLRQQGSDLFDLGRRPGEPSQVVPNNRQSYDTFIQQQRVSESARERSGAILGQGSVDVEERRALEREEEEREREERDEALDSIGNWPLRAPPPPNGP